MVVTPAVGRVGWIRAAARPAAAAAPPRLCNPRLCCALLCALLQCNSAAPFTVVLLCAHGPLGKPAGSLGKVWSKSPGARRASRCCCSAARTAAPHHTLPRSSKRASAPGSVSGSRGSPRTAQHSGILHRAHILVQQRALRTSVRARQPAIPLGKDLPLLSTRCRQATAIDVVSEICLG